LVAREIGIAFRGKPDAIVVTRRSDILRVRRADGNEQLRADRAARAADAVARRKKLAKRAKIFFRRREDFWKPSWKSCRWHRASFSCGRVGRKMDVGAAVTSRKRRTAENAEDAEKSGRLLLQLAMS